MYNTTEEKIYSSPKVIIPFYVLEKFIISLGIIFIVRLLQPSAFGIAALTQMFLTMIMIGKFNVFHSALVYEKDDKDSTYNAGFTADFAISVLLYIILFVLAPIWANFYKTEVLTVLIRLGGLSILIDSFTLVPLAKLEKKLKFNIIFKVIFFITLFRIILTIVLALKGFSFWSIILAGIASDCLSVLLFNLLEFTPIKFYIDILTLKRLMGYGKYVYVIQFADFILRNIVSLFISRVIGVAALGYFLVAYKWGFWIMHNIFSLLDRILFPVYARWREKAGVSKELFLKTLRYSSIVVFFISIGLFLIAEDFVNIILGPKWNPSIVPLKILCFAGLVEFIGLLSYTYLRGSGYIKVESIRRIVYIAILLFLMYPLIRIWGLIGGAWTILIATTITQGIYFIYSARKMMINFTDMMKNISIPVAASFLMVGVTLTVKYFISDINIKDTLLFASIVIIEISVYFATIYLFMGKEIRTALHNIKKISLKTKEDLTLERLQNL